MAIAPTWLNGVTADELPPREFKAVAGVVHLWSLDVAEHVRFAAARSARTGATQLFQIEVRFCSVTPLHRQLVADELNVRWFDAHREKVMQNHGEAQESNWMLDTADSSVGELDV